MQELQRDQTHKPYYKTVGKSDLEKNQTRDGNQREPIRIHDGKINHQGNPSFEETDKKVQGAKEGFASGVH